MRPERLNTRKMIKRFYRAGWRRPWWLLIAFVVVPLIVGRIALTPLVQTAIRQHLNRLHGVAVVSFRDLDIFLFPPSFTFKDVTIQGGGTAGSGDGLVVDRLEVHVASLQELMAASPRIRLRMVRPQMRLHPGAQDLERLARALPTARAEVTSVEGGSITVAAGGGDKVILESVSGDIEGLATGAEVGSGGWQIWVDGRLLERNPIHAFVKLEPTRAWQATVTLQENPGPTLGAKGPVPLALSVDSRVRGSGGRIEAKTHVSWAGESAPRVVAEDMLRALPETWAGVNLVPIGLKAGLASVGQSVDLVAETDASKADAPKFRAFDVVGLIVNLLRLANQAVLPPPAGMATLTETGESPVTDPDLR
jgi:hypothetical protein